MLRILLADDDRVSCKLLGGLLKKWGYEVVVVHDGSAAMRELVSPDAPQLAILDWIMPGLDGTEVIKAVRSLGQTTYTYILLLSSKGQKRDLLEGMDAGADGYLQKPFDRDELRARVRAGERIITLQTDLIHAQEKLQYAATHDSLTGIWNRGAVLEFLEREISRRQRTFDPLGVVLADIDNFKKINDMHGHLVGDSVLREVTRRLALEIRPYDAVGRYGGEEFLMVLPGSDASCLTVSAQRLRRCIADRPVETSKGAIAVTLSLGLSSVERGKEGMRDSESFLHGADEALYAAKAAGRNCVVSSASLSSAVPVRGTGNLSELRIS
jgi:diguanylate cyclase (GGDEF)-like protein